MDQKKIGNFLRSLRKEKGLTQEQLAEQFYVSDRTVSRWENGNNMPDLSILVELADYYDVDIRELINGERKSENMEKEQKETLLAVADYAENEKAKLLRILCTISSVGAVSLIIGMIMMDLGETIELPVFDFLQGAMFGTALGALIVAILYSTGVLGMVRKQKENKKWLKPVLVVCIVICLLLLMASLAATLSTH